MQVVCSPADCVVGPDSTLDGFTWISLNFRRDYINVYLKGDLEGSREVIKAQFNGDITLKGGG